jgi:hypothetical protein
VICGPIEPRSTAQRKAMHIEAASSGARGQQTTAHWTNPSGSTLSFIRRPFLSAVRARLRLLKSAGGNAGGCCSSCGGGSESRGESRERRGKLTFQHVGFTVRCSKRDLNTAFGSVCLWPSASCWGRSALPPAPCTGKARQSKGAAAAAEEKAAGGGRQGAREAVPQGRKQDDAHTRRVRANATDSTQGQDSERRRRLLCPRRVTGQRKNADACEIIAKSELKPFQAHHSIESASYNKCGKCQALVIVIACAAGAKVALQQRVTPNPMMIASHARRCHTQNDSTNRRPPSGRLNTSALR